MIEFEPVIAITDEYIATDEADTVFGKRWGSQIVTVTPEQLDALQQGRYLEYHQGSLSIQEGS